MGANIHSVIKAVDVLGDFDINDRIQFDEIKRYKELEAEHTKTGDGHSLSRLLRSKQELAVHRIESKIAQLLTDGWRVIYGSQTAINDYSEEQIKLFDSIPPDAPIWDTIRQQQ